MAPLIVTGTEKQLPSGVSVTVSAARGATKHQSNKARARPNNRFKTHSPAAQSTKDCTQCTVFLWHAEWGLQIVKELLNLGGALDSVAIAFDHFL